MKHLKTKNEEFLIDTQTICGNIANKILNAGIDAERTFRCKWHKISLWLTLSKIQFLINKLENVGLKHYGDLKQVLLGETCCRMYQTFRGVINYTCKSNFCLHVSTT